MSIGVKIKSLRTDHNLTQKELAEILNISRVSLCQYETGTRSLNDELKIKIAEYFNISLDYLMGREEAWSGLNIIKPPVQKTQIQTIYDALSPIQRDMLVAYGQALVDSSKQTDIKKRA